MPAFLFLYTVKTPYMKRVLTILFAAMLLAACNGPSKEEARRHLAQEAKAGNEEMKKQDFTQATVCTGITFDNDNLYYNYTIDERYTNMSVFRNNREKLKKDIETAVATAAGIQGIIKSLKVLDGKMIYTYRGSISNDTVCIIVDME